MSLSYSFYTAKNLRDVVIIGDFNVYQNFEWPIKLALGESKNGANPCWSYAVRYGVSQAGTFKDAWKVGGGKGNGFTFSNMVNKNK